MTKTGPAGIVIFLAQVPAAGVPWGWGKEWEGRGDKAAGQWRFGGAPDR